MVLTLVLKYCRWHRLLILRLPAPFPRLGCANSEQPKARPWEMWPKAKADTRL